MKNKKAFTLIELLIVIAIIGILSSVVLVSLNNGRAKARDAQRKSDLNNIAKAYELYYSENGIYYIPGTGYSGLGNGYFNYISGSYPKSMATGLEEEGYFSQAPIDPSANEIITTPNDPHTQYLKYQCGSGFFTYAKLENPSASDIATYTKSKALGCQNVDGNGINYAVGHI